MKIFGISLGGHNKVFEMMRWSKGTNPKVEIDHAMVIEEYDDLKERFSETELSLINSENDETVKRYLEESIADDKMWNEFLRSVVVFHENDVRSEEEVLSRNIVRSYPKKEVEKLKKMKVGIAPEELNERYDVIAISATSDRWPMVKSLVEYLRGNGCNNIVIGGPIANETSLPFLRKLNCHINTGCYDKFLEYAAGDKKLPPVIRGSKTLKIEKVEELKNSPLAEITYNFSKSKRDKGGITYYGYDDAVAVLDLIGVAGCGNSCSYCCSPRNFNIPQDVWKKVIEGMRSEAGIICVNILDDNPFKHVEKYAGIMNRFLDLYKEVLISAYVDPSTIIREGVERKMIEKIIRKADSATFFVGRECTNQYEARKLGRKWNGKVRDDVRLDKEKKAIKWLIGKLDKHLGDEYELGIAYIEGGYDVDNILREMNEFYSKGNGTIFAQIQPLDAFPSSECWYRNCREGTILAPFPGVAISNIKSVKNVTSLQYL